MSQLKSIDYDEFIESYSSMDMVIVDISAEWCNPCKKLLPILIKLSEEFSEKVDIVTIDGDDNNNEEFLSNYKVSSYPTLIFFKKGEEWRRILGLKTEEFLRENIEEFIPTELKPAKYD